MPISGLVLTIADNPIELQQLAILLDTDTRFVQGALVGTRLPIVVDAVDLEEETHLIELLQRAPAVRLIEVVYYDFSDLESVSGAPGQRRRLPLLSTQGVQ